MKCSNASLSYLSLLRPVSFRKFEHISGGDACPTRTHGEGNSSAISSRAFSTAPTTRSHVPEHHSLSFESDSSALVLISSHFPRIFEYPHNRPARLIGPEGAGPEVGRLSGFHCSIKCDSATVWLNRMLVFPVSVKYHINMKSARYL